MNGLEYNLNIYCLLRILFMFSEYNEEEEKLLLIMEKGDTDFASVIRSRSSVNAVNPTLVRFYWQEMLESVGQIHEKSIIFASI